MANVVMEKSTAYLSVSFRDKSGAAQAPTAATYKVHDKGSGQVLLPETTLEPAATVEITLPPSLNTLVDPSRSFETRVVTVAATFGVDDGVTNQYEYTVENLRYL